jgi:hypothetical protein
MAREEHKSDKRPAKRHLKGLTVHKADDGGFVHEHHYQGERGRPDTSSYGGYSPDLEDVLQHVQDHLGPQADDQDQTPAPDQGGGAAPAQDAGPAPQ